MKKSIFKYIELIQRKTTKPEMFSRITKKQKSGKEIV